MKTIEEAAKEYNGVAEWHKDSFKAGVEFAQQWIKVEDELPIDYRDWCLKNFDPKKNADIIYSIEQSLIKEAI